MSRRFGNGSPPQGRRSGVGQNAPGHSTRFTPAGAGIGQVRDGVTIWSPVHPRRCGDRSSRLRRYRWALGSPPQVRGSGNQHLWLALKARFTPAGAGIGIMNTPYTCAVAVHPRRCGDRGDEIEPPEYPGRFTPAGAGIGCDELAISNRCPVHPRRCGDRRC